MLTAAIIFGFIGFVTISDYDGDRYSHVFRRIGLGFLGVAGYFLVKFVNQ